MDFTLLEIEKTYLFFTVTYFFVGRVVKVTPAEVLLADASLIYEIPEVAVALEKGTIGENVKLGDFVLKGFVGATPWRTKLPGKNK